MHINGIGKIRSLCVRSACKRQQRRAHLWSVSYAGFGKQKRLSVKHNGAGDLERSALVKIARRSGRAGTVR